MPEQFWFKDPSVLFRDDTWTQFVPVKSMTTAEALNSVLRFTVYSSILLGITTRSASYLMAIPIVSLASVILFTMFPNGKQIEAFLNGLKENFTMPTPHNPFMNVLLTDIQDSPDRPDAAPITDPKVRDEIAKAFAKTSNIYMDTSDVFDQTQAMRTFSTLQSSTIPNNQDEFLAFLAKGYDEPNTSSAPSARGGKLLSEGPAPSRGSVRNLSNTTLEPEGAVPRVSAPSTEQLPL